ncbi:MAG: hypothetical protein R3D98_05900 [Candidatus Krumholzibacteriia bacterium]
MRELRALKFLFTAPLILLMLVVINWLTSPGDWWVQWAALGIGIAWVISLLRVIRAAIVLGGLSALGCTCGGGTSGSNREIPADLGLFREDCCQAPGTARGLAFHTANRNSCRRLIFSARVTTSCQ